MRLETCCVCMRVYIEKEIMTQARDSLFFFKHIIKSAISIERRRRRRLKRKRKERQKEEEEEEEDEK